jgi:Glycosyl transferases group 1
MSNSTWHIITCEYPPQCGGVSDYTKLVAHGLADAGDEVHVWCPRAAEGNEGKGQKTEGRRQTAESSKQKAEGSDCQGKRVKGEAEEQSEEEQRAKSEESGDSSLITHHPSLVSVHRELGTFRPSDLRRASKQLDQFPAPRRLLVQWVPHGYGYRSMNLPFCFWLWWRAKFKADRVELMVHEPFLAFGEGSIKQDLAAAVHRVMVILLLNAASQIWVSTQEWEGRLRPFLFGRKVSIGWLPVPSNIPVVDDPDGIAKARAKYATNGTRLIGHFGAYNDYMADVMSELLPSLLDGENDLSMLLLGKGSTELRDSLVSAHPKLSRKLHATGEVAAEEISKHISACDVMLQPYQDGVSGRRTSVMAPLEHGLPVVTTRGKATERCWFDNEWVKLTQCGDAHSTVQAVSSCQAKGTNRFDQPGALLYDRVFALQNTIECLTRRY